MHGVLLVVNVAFASLAVAGKVAMRDLPPETVSFVRVAGAAILFALLHVALRGPPRLGRRDAAIAAVASLVGIAANQLLFLGGLSRTLAINSYDSRIYALRELICSRAKFFTAFRARS